MKDGIIPSRITEAREARAISMGDLAVEIGITRQSVSKYERGIITPAPEMLQAISNYLEFPISFFYKKEIGDIARSSTLFFRSKSNISKKVKNACKYQVKWADTLKKQLGQYLDFIEKEIPTIDNDYEDLSYEDVEQIALWVRHKWDIGDSPICDLIGLLENKGAIITHVATNNLCQFKGIDGFSSWKDGTPYIIYSNEKSAVRIRNSLAHELGHLVMHSSISEEDSIKKEVIDKADEQADRFAAAFLLPATSFPNDVHGPSLKYIEGLKRKWGVSMGAIIYRCQDLELLTENQISYLKKQMTSKQYWYKEPLDDVLEIESPEILRDAIYLLIENQILTKESFINNTGFSVNDLKSICGLPDDFFNFYNPRQKPKLKVLS